MKQIICTLLLVLLYIPCANAQEPGAHAQPVPDSTLGRRSSPLTTIGKISIPVGAVSLFFGLAITGDHGGKSDPNDAQNNTPLILMGVGAGLIIGGVACRIIGAVHDRKSRLSVIAPKRNEVGLAYNLSIR